MDGPLDAATIEDDPRDPLLASFDLQISSHSFLGVCSLLLLIYSLMQIGRLWLAGSKISNRKRVFIQIMLLLFVRFLWFFLANLGFTTVFPRPFLDAVATIFSSTPLDHNHLDSPSSSIFPSLPWTSGWLMPLFSALFMRFLYLYPLTLIFQASCWLLLNWFELFQKEKLRKKLPRLIRSKALADPNAPRQHSSRKLERSAAHQRQKDLNRLCVNFVVLINSAACLAGLLWCLASLPLFDTQGVASHWLTAASLLRVPSLIEASLALVCSLCLLYLCDASFRRLADLLLASSTHSSKLKRHNLLTIGLSISAMLYFASIVILFISSILVSVLLPSSSSSSSSLFSSSSSSGSSSSPSAPSSSASSSSYSTTHSSLPFDAPLDQAARYHLLMRLFELLHCALVLRLLGSPSLSLKAPFPSETKAITQEWLTSVLQENGHLSRGLSVMAFWSENLKGGCHYKVSRVNLRYSKARTAAPKTVVVKILYWNKPILERIFLHIKWLWEMEQDREVMYLKSYQMEHRFYKRQVYTAECGLKVPQVYYNLEDVFNTRFGMVCQDLSALEDGQPNGFNLADCETFMQHLAQFHAAHWGSDDQSNPDGFYGWPEAGYWTGDKREATKTKVADAWVDCCSNFPELQLRAGYPMLGQMLLERLAFVREEFDKAETPEYRTLCHGDFKISNLFIGNLASALLRRNSSTNSLRSFADFSSSGLRQSGLSEMSASEISDDPDINQDPVDFDTRDVYAIDWQWFGLGSCCIDVVAFLVTSPLASVLPKVDHLASVYYQALLQYLPPHFAENFPFTVYRHHFNVALVDFCTFCVTAKWSKMTPDDFTNNARKVQDGLHLRSYAHMGFIIDRASLVLQEWADAYPLDQ